MASPLDFVDHQIFVLSKNQAHSQVHGGSYFCHLVDFAYFPGTQKHDFYTMCIGWAFTPSFMLFGVTYYLKLCNAMTSYHTFQILLKEGQLIVQTL